MGLTDRLCRMTGGTPSALGCASGDGAIVLAINKNTGQVVWRAKAETHPSSKVTGSISGHGDRIFVPVGNWEEDWARSYPNIFVEPIDPASHYPCCSARGSLVAMDVNTGKILWKRHTNIGNDPDHELAPELRALLGTEGILRHFDLRPQPDRRCGEAPGLYRDGADHHGAASGPGLRAGQAQKRRSQRQHSGLARGRDLQQPEREAAYLRERDDRGRHGYRARQLGFLRAQVRRLESRVRRAGPVRLVDGGSRALPGAARERNSQLHADSDRSGHGIRPATEAREERQARRRQTRRRGGRRQQGRQALRPRSRHGEKDLGDQRRPGRRLRRLAVRDCYRRRQGVLRHDQFAEQWPEHQDALRPGHALPRYQRLHGARPEDRALREA